MKVYVVTAGEYSDYHIDAIFTDENVARQYANLDSDRDVEEWETDIESVEFDQTKLVYEVCYNIVDNCIETLCLTSSHNCNEEYLSEYTLIHFTFYVSTSETLNKSIRWLGMHSDMLLRIAQDRFAMWCDAHETSRHELMQKKAKRDEQFAQRYPMYSTSTYTSGPNMHDPLFNPYYYADARMPDIMKQYAEEHDGAFPEMLTLVKMYADQVADVKEKHEREEP